MRAALASGTPLDPKIANDKELRKDFDYDVSRDIAKEQGEIDIDDEYSELSGIVGTDILRFCVESRLSLTVFFRSESAGNDIQRPQF